MNGITPTRDQEENTSVVKIVHVIHRLDFGGLENGVVNLINHSPDWLQHIIITLTGSNEVFAKRIQKNVQIYDVNKQAGQDWGVYLRLWKLFRALKPDIVHTRNLATLEAQIPAFLAGVKTRIHGEHGWDIADPNGDVVKYQKMRRVIGALVHKFIPLSSHLEHYLLRKVGIPARKVERICNGVDVNRFRTTHEGISGRITLNVISVGRLEEIKGHKYLISALAHVKERLSSLNIEAKSGLCSLTLVGDGSCRSALERQVIDAGLDNWVTFLGSRSDIPELLRGSNCFVLPSEAEGISNTVLEAMATGLPVIATDVGGNADLILPYQTGILVPAKDASALAEALLYYLQDTDRLLEHGKAGLERVNKEFSLPVMTGKYYRIYRDLGKH